MKELIGYQLVAQFISASVSIFFFSKIVKRKLHAILQKEDNYILPLGETTKMASANTLSASGRQPVSSQGQLHEAQHSQPRAVKFIPSPFALWSF